jgi:hypothetical protein
MTVFNRNDYTVLASAARTTLVAATDLNIPEGVRDVEVIHVGTAHTTSPSLTLTIKDAAGATLLVSAAITTDTTTVLRYGLDFPNVTNLSAAGIPTEGMTVEVAVGDADSATYSIVRRIA